MSEPWRWEGDLLISGMVVIPVLPGRDRAACEEVARGIDDVRAARIAARAAERAGKAARPRPVAIVVAEVALPQSATEAAGYVQAGMEL